MKYSVKKIGTVIALMAWSAFSQAITFDGKYDGIDGASLNADGVSAPFVANGYDVVFSFGYSDGPVTLGGGILAFGYDAGNGAVGDADYRPEAQYVFFSHPLGFNDNSYGQQSVGWAGADKDHTVGNFVGSEHYGYWLSGSGALDGSNSTSTGDLLIRVNYDEPEADGVGTGSASITISSEDPEAGGNGVEVKDKDGATFSDALAISTVQYNADQKAGGGVGSGDYDSDIPDPSPTISGATNALGDPCAGNDSFGTSLDATTGEIKNDGCYSTADKTWIYNAGVELQFRPDYFSSGGAAITDFSTELATLQDAFAYFDFRANIGGSDFAIAHASPAKTTALLVVDDTTEVPEPQSLALFGLGLLLLRRQLRRS